MRFPLMGALILTLLKLASTLDLSRFFGTMEYPGCSSVARCLLFVLTFNLVTMTANGNYRTCDRGTIQPREPYYLVGHDVELVCNANHEVKGILTFWNQTEYVDPQFIRKINSTAIKLVVPRNTVSKMYSLMCVETDSLDTDYSSCINNVYLEFEYPVRASNLTLHIYDWDEMWLNWSFNVINEENINVTCKYVGGYTGDINLTVFYSGDGSEYWAVCPDQSEKECYWDPETYNGESVYLFQVMTTNTRINVTTTTAMVFNDTDQYVEPATIKGLKVLDGYQPGCVHLRWMVPKRQGLNYTFNITYVSDCDSSSVKMIQAYYIYRYRDLLTTGRKMNKTVCELDPSVLYFFNIVGGVNITSKPISYWSKPLDPPISYETKREIPREVDANVTQDTEAGGVLLSWDMACATGGSGNVQSYILKYCVARMDTCKCFSDWTRKKFNNKTGSFLVHDDDWHDGMYICLEFGAENELGKGTTKRMGPIRIKDYDTTRTLTTAQIVLIVCVVLLLLAIALIMYRCRRCIINYFKPPEISDKVMKDLLEQSVKTSEYDPLLEATSSDQLEKPGVKSAISDADSGASSLETVSTLRDQIQRRDADGSTDSAIGSHNSARDSRVVIDGGQLCTHIDNIHDEKNVSGSLADIEYLDEKLITSVTKAIDDSGDSHSCDKIIGYDTNFNVSDSSCALSSENETFADNETETENLSAVSVKSVSSTHSFTASENVSSANRTSDQKEVFATIECNDPSVINLSLTNFDCPSNYPLQNSSAPETETSFSHMDEEIDGSCYDFNYESEDDNGLSRGGYNSVKCIYVSDDEEEEEEEKLEVNPELLESHNDSFNNSGSLSSTDQYVKASLDLLPQAGTDMGKDGEIPLDILTKLGSKPDAAVDSDSNTAGVEMDIGV